MNGMDILMAVIGSVLVMLFGIFFGLVFKGIDRVLSARMQARIGPRVRQPFWDVGKLFSKENIIPENAVKWMFSSAPVLGLASSAVMLLYLPLGPLAPVLQGHGDIILMLYLLVIPSLAMVTGGFASGSPYAAVGAQREMVMMMSYEFPLAAVVVSIAWKLNVFGIANPFSITSIASNPIWMNSGILGIIGSAILLVVLIIVTPAELSKIPFDAPEAETEIVGGLLAEYSGRNLGIFYLADAVKTIVMGALLVAIFFPWGIAGIVGLAAGSVGAIAADIAFFLLKLFLVLFVSVTVIRTSFARLKIDQIVYTYWAPLTIAALFGLVLIIWDLNLLGIEWYPQVLGGW
ncbi:MAG: NADH-quinone oxidoreductase subunit H [Candidatus Thermoplasmatota archaeon]|nr:NADH-quinone oxidoreductase subunit H [Candidatus Thermoplasmatota archaeon]